MAITLYRPGLVDPIRRFFPALFGEDLFDLPEFEELTEALEPRMDIVETAKHYKLKAEFPGLKKEDVKVEVKDGVLTLTAERKREHEEKEEGYTRYERYYGAIHRAFALPETVAAEKIKAEMKDGLLTVTLPKTEKAVKETHEIPIQ